MRLLKRIRGVTVIAISLSASFILVAPPADAISNLLFDNGQIYTGIGWHTSFDGYSMKAAAYYDTYDPVNNRIILSGAGEDGADIMSGLQCRNAVPPSRASTWNGTYATVRLDAGSGVSVTYNISRTNFCSGNSATTINSRTSPNTARLRGQYQLPLGSPVVDAQTGKYKVTVSISFTTAVREGPFGDYNPNALFRLRAPGGLMGAIAGDHTATNPVNRNALSSRVYSNAENHYLHRYDFGSTCDLNSDVQKVVGLRDPDAYYADGTEHITQGLGSSVGWSKLNLSIQERFSTSEPYQWISASRYNVLNSSGSVELYGGIPSVASTTREGPGGVTPDTLVSFNMKPGGKYRMVVHNAYTRNFLQAYLPTDAIYNAIDCAEIRGGSVYPTVERTDGSGSALVGSTVQVRPSLNNGDPAYDAQARYEYVAWLDRSDDTFGAGDNELYRKSIPPTGTPLDIDAGDAYDLSSLVDTSFTIDEADFASICFSLRAIAVAPSENDDTRENPAKLCIPIGKKPHVQVSGGDVITRGASSIVNAPEVTMGGRTYGSWGEYGVLSNNRLDTYSGGSLMASLNASTESKKALLFANTPQPGFLGSATTLPQLSKPLWPQTTITTNSANANSMNSNSINRRTGNFELTGGNNYDKLAVLEVNGTLVISGNITYKSQTYTDPRTIPQLMITANNIYIRPNVTRIDAWLIAPSGVINTCHSSGTATPNPYFANLQRTGSCSSQLRVNGPVQANRLILRRTAGAEGSSTDVAALRRPAEVFNMRSDAYVWSYGQASSEGVIRTETITELPPRF